MTKKTSKYSNAGAPLWMATFADLMTLLVCFFVLFLSFSTVDEGKFRKMAFSLENAFRPNRIVVADISVTEPKPSKNILQYKHKYEALEDLKRQVFNAKVVEVEQQEQKIKHFLTTEINEGLLTVEREQLKIIIRVNEKGSFPSGSAVLKSDFEPVMNKITQAVVGSGSNGIVHVAGHTDDVPISTQWYRSNWELAASRSVTVAHFMINKKGLDPARIVIEGYANTRPLVANDSIENKEKNRRVEIVIVQQDPSIGLTLEDVTDSLID